MKELHIKVEATYKEHSNTWITTIMQGEKIFDYFHDSTKDLSEANAARIVYAWNNIDKVIEDRNELAQLFNDEQTLRISGEVALDIIEKQRDQSKADNEALKEQMSQSLRLYENQNQMIIKLQEQNRELLEALKDLTVRAQKARSILQSGPAKGFWGVLDTEAATELISKHSK